MKRRIKNLMDEVKGIVIKVGTAGITYEDNGINREVIRRLAQDCACLIKELGKNVTIVTSGAIASARGKIDCKNDLCNERLAALGQALLMQVYIEEFDKVGINVGQILLVDDDFDSKKRLAQLKGTYTDLLKNKEVPIINENDAIATEEITFGDNDILAAKVLTELNQDLLVNLTVYDGLLRNGAVVEIGKSFEASYYNNLGKEIRRGGSGGLKSKLKSVGICIGSGKIGIIGNVKYSVLDIIRGKVKRTIFYPE